MPKFGKRSKERLSTCHFDLQRLFNEVIKYYDCKVICGHRSKEEQDKVYNEGRSKVQWPNSKHNKTPSMAVDVVPYFKDFPHVRWEDKEAFYFLSGIVHGVSSMLGIKLRWGGNWDSDDELHDQSFFDLPHYEIIE